MFEASTTREVAKLVHPSRVRRVAFSPDGTLVATVSADNTARVLRPAPGARWLGWGPASKC